MKQTKGMKQRSAGALAVAVALSFGLFLVGYATDVQDSTSATNVLLGSVSRPAKDDKKGVPFVEIQINVPAGDTTEPDESDDYACVTNTLGLPTTTCRAKLKEAFTQDVTVVLVDLPGGGVVMFPGATDTTKTLVLNKDGTTWTNFFISGAVVSSTTNDAKIQAREGSASGQKLGEQELTVVDFEKLKLATTNGSLFVEDLTRPDESATGTNTLYLAEGTNGTVDMTIQGWWKPACVDSNFFRWEIVLTNGSPTSQWTPNNQKFTDNPTNSTWSATDPTNRQFLVRGWYDFNLNGTYDADEPHRSLYVNVLNVEFDKDPNQNYGYDKYEEMNAVYYSDDPVIRPGPDYDFVSVEKNTNTTVKVTIKGCDPSQVFFTSEDETTFKPDTLHVASSPGILQIDGKDKDKAMKHLYARAGSETGPICAKLGVCVYKKIVPTKKYKHFNVSDNASPGTQLSINVDPTVLGQFLNVDIFNQAVVGLTFQDGGNLTNCNYDTSPTNGILDIYTGDPNTEGTKVLTDLLAGGWNPLNNEVPVIHTHAMRWVARIAAISADRKTITLQAESEWIDRQLAAGPNVKPRYWIEDWSSIPPAREQHKLVAKDSVAKTITLEGTLGTAFSVNTSGLIWPLGGLSGGQIWVEDVGAGAGNLNAYKVYLGHELGHYPDLGGWIDLAPEKNLMYGGPYDGTGDLPIELRYRPLPHYYQTEPDDNQWDKVPGR